MSTGDVELCQRLGRRQSGKNRPIKIVLKDTKKKFSLLNKRKEISRNEQLRALFHQSVYINPDSSPLMQAEEKRLRAKLKQLKTDDPLASCFIRSGSLHYNGEIIDSIDITNQLF